MTECQYRGRPPGLHCHLLLLLLVPHLLNAADNPLDSSDLSPSLLLPHIKLDEDWKRFLLPPYAPPKGREAVLELEPPTDRRRFEVIPSPNTSSSNPWVPIIPKLKQAANPSPSPTRVPHPHFDVRLQSSGSLSSKDHLPKSHQEVPKRQQYQDHRPPKKSPPRKRLPQLGVRAREKAVPKKQIKLVLERRQPLINLVPKKPLINMVPKNSLTNLVPKWAQTNLVPKRRQTAKFLPPRTKIAASKSLRPSPPQPKRQIWGELHSRHTLPQPFPHHTPLPPPREARRKQGRRAFELGGLLGNLLPKKRIIRPTRGEPRSSKIQVKPYLGKALPRPLGRPPPRGGDRRQQRRGNALVERLPKGALAQAISLGVVAAVLAV